MTTATTENVIRIRARRETLRDNAQRALAGFSAAFSRTLRPPGSCSP